LRRLKAKRVSSGSEIDGLRGRTSALQERYLRTLRRRAVTAGEGVTVSGYSSAAREHPGRPRWRILVAPRQVWNLKAAVGESGAGNIDYLRKRCTARRRIAGIATVVADDAMDTDG